MNYDDKIDKILSTINPERVKVLYEQKKIQNIIANRINGIEKEKKIAIRGGGVHTQRLLKIIDNGRISAIIDSNRKPPINGIKVVTPNQTKDLDVDVFILSSYIYRFEMYEELKKLKGDYEIIDIYDVLRMNGVYLRNVFYKDMELPEDLCEEIICLKSKYSKENDKELRGFYLEEIIFDCLHMRDFITAQKYMNEYMDNDYSRKELYKSISKDMDETLIQMKEELWQRKQKDIIVFWNDGLSYDEMNEWCPFLKETAKKSMNFNNVYATTGWTRAI